VPDTFNDEIHVFYYLPDGKMNYHVYPATTDPGTYWLNNPMMPKGTAVLKEGQYVNTYGIGLHRGQKSALVQVRPVTVLRDDDRDEWIDFESPEDTGMFGINIHYPSGQGGNKSIERDSAGCQVFEWNNDFVQFMLLCEQHRARYGNRFTYTLVDFRAKRKVLLKRLATGAMIAASLIFGYIKYQEANEQT
jgi:hypothetical protein